MFSTLLKRIELACTLRTIWLLLPFVLVALGFGLQPLKSWDYWWHLSFGRMVDATGQMPVANHFLYTLDADHPSYVQPWLSQWLLFKGHESLGLAGMLIIRNLGAALAFGLLGVWAARRSGSAMFGSILALFGAAFGFFTISLRSEFLAWPLFLGLMFLAYQVRHCRAKPWWLLAFPLATALWANFHGTFVFAPAMAIAFGIAATLDRTVGSKFSELSVHLKSGPSPFWWFGAAAASILASALNPRGFEVYTYLLASSNPEIRNTVSEWMPTTLTFPDIYGSLFWSGAAAALVLMVKNNRRLDWADLGMLAWMVILVAGQSRFLLFWAVTAPIILAPYVAKPSKVVKETPGLSELTMNAMIIGLMILAAFGAQPWSGQNQLAADLQIAPARTESPLLGLVHLDTPLEAIQALKAEDPATLRLFHDHRYPGFLLFHLLDETPHQLVFVDNRIELPAQEIWRELDAIGRGEEWESRLAHWEVNAVVTSTQEHDGLVKAITASAKWQCPISNELWVFCKKER